MDNMNHIDTTIPVQQRIKVFLQIAENPYHLQVDGTRVAMQFKEGAPSLQQKMTNICNQAMN